jgi:hypothetical protein
MTRDELKEVIRAVLEELRHEQQEILAGRLQKAREALKAKREAEGVGPDRRIVLSGLTKIVLETLRSTGPVSLGEWRERLIESTGAKEEAARKLISRAVPRLLEAGLIEEKPPRIFRAIDQAGASPEP